MIRRPPRSTQSRSSAASDVYNRQVVGVGKYLSPRVYVGYGVSMVGAGQVVGVVEDAAGHRLQARDADRLALRPERVETERVGVLAAELEDVTDLDAAGETEPTPAVRARIALANLGCFDSAIGSEITACHDVDRMLATHIRTRQPGGTRDHAWIDDVPNSRFTFFAKDLGADVTSNQCGVVLEVIVLERDGLQWFRVPGGQRYPAFDRRIPGAFS